MKNIYTYENLIMLGEYIKGYRLKLNLSSEYVAAQVGISRATYSAIENGSQKVAIGSYAAVLKYLDDINVRLPKNISDDAEKKRASKRLTNKKLKQNAFEVFCIESYAQHTGKQGNYVFKLFAKEKVLDLLRTYYDDLHAMGREALMDLFDEYLGRETA